MSKPGAMMTAGILFISESVFCEMSEKENNWFEADGEDEALTERILEFARGYQSADFPNPDREECLLPDELLNIASSGELPNPRLREHLINCSPCFLEFQTARKTKKEALTANATKAKSGSWFGYLWLWFPVGALFLLVCGLVGLVIYGFFAKSETATGGKNIVVNPVSQKQTDNEPASPMAAKPATENKVAEQTQSPPQQSNQSPNKANRSIKVDSDKEPEFLAKSTINLDLAKSTVLRDGTSRETVHNLPSKIVTLKVKLIANSPSGNYEVSLLDASNKPILESLTKKSDGKSLRINLDLRNKSGRARLCVAPTGEIPDCFAVRIGRAE
jgi:hypothetical protein